MKNRCNIAFFKEHKIHIVALVVTGIFLGWLVYFLLESPLKASTEVVISEGQDISTIADKLKVSGVIANKLAFIVYTTITGNEKKLQAGRYIFRPGVTIPAVVRFMSEGFAESDDVAVTIPEGYNVFDIDQRLASFGLIKEGEFAGKYYANEGQFFPDTYRFKEKGETVDTIAQKMKNHLNLKLKDISFVLSTLVFHDVLVKASVLEKEARKKEDMRLIAGVIENRLTRGILLQMDATVAYGACLRNYQLLRQKNGQANTNYQTYKYCDVSQVGVADEIKIDGPYNTYIRPGLPPGPIANPGITAIQAILNPIKNDYLYYLSTRDGSQIIFSKTAVEHAANRKKYLGL